MSKTNLEKYQRQVIKEQDEEIAFAQMMDDIRAREEAVKQECLYCHSRNATKVTTVAKVMNTDMFWVFGQKRKYQWYCNNCKYY